MPDSIHTRPATQQDFHAILALANQLSDTITVRESYLADIFPSLLDEERHCFLVAIVNDAIVGYASGYFHQAIYAGGLVAYVDEIVIEPAFRSSKIGSILMSAFEKISKEKGCVLISLATFGAKGFYEKLGYSSKAGYFKKYLDQTGERETDSVR